MKFNAPFVMKLRIYVNNTGVGNYSKYEIYAHPSLTFVDDFYCGPIVSNLNIARSSDFKISTLPSGLTFDEGSDNISGTLFGYKRIFSRAGRYDQYAGEFPTDACARLLP
jgi:hypothetical protein